MTANLKIQEGKMKKSRLLGMTCAMLIGEAQAIVIDFDSLTVGTIVTTQFSEVTFSGTGALPAHVLSFAVSGNSSPNVIASGDSLADGSKDTFLDFTLPVSNLSFVIVGDGSSGSAGMLDIYVNSIFDTTLSLTVDGVGSSADLIDLTSFINVTRIEMYDITDPAGIGYDDFTFDVANVPIPSAVWLFGSGLIGLVGFARRKA